MFARIKVSGKYKYLQIVENYREGKKTRQRVIATIGRLDQLHAKGNIDTLVKSIARYSDQALLVISGKSDVKAHTKRIGPALIFERLWQQTGIKKIIKELVVDRKYAFDMERAVFLTVLHRLFVSGSDRACSKWCQDYLIKDVEGLKLHHLYRAMAFLGETVTDQEDEKLLTPRCIKDIVEERLFCEHRDLFTGLDLVFFDTTSIYFEGVGGETLGRKGHSKDSRPDLNQMIVGAVLDTNGKPICCEMWPGNTADMKTFLPVANRIKNRFHVGQFCIIADRGMISAETIKELENRKLSYILGARMRKVNEIKRDVLDHEGQYREVYPEGRLVKDPSPLQVKEVTIADRRYIVCFNPKQARKDATDRQLIIESLQKKLRLNPKALVGNKGYRRYLKMTRSEMSVDLQKVTDEEKFDGKWVLRTNTNFTAEEIALKYKELWQVEQVFRDVKTALATRPVFHQKDETIRGHVFCSFLALILRKELDRCLEEKGFNFEWEDIKQDLTSLQEICIEDNGKSLKIRTETMGTCGKVFQAVGVALPPTVREI